MIRNPLIRNLRRHRSRALFLAFLVTAVAFGGGTQALAPAPASAAMQEGEECEFWGFYDCEEANGGSGGAGDTTGSVEPTAEPEIPPGEVIVVEDTKPQESAVPQLKCKPGYLCLPPSSQRQCADGTQFLDCARLPIPIPLGKPGRRVSDCPIAAGPEAIDICERKLAWDQCTAYYPPGPKRQECRDIELKKLVRDLPICAQAQQDLDGLMHFKAQGSGYSAFSWKELGYLQKEQRLRSTLRGHHCDRFPPMV